MFVDIYAGGVRVTWRGGQVRMNASSLLLPVQRVQAHTVPTLGGCKLSALRCRAVVRLSRCERLCTCDAGGRCVQQHTPRMLS